jgi:hypothetical protein
MHNTVDWDSVYTKAAYSLSHSKKALSSNNFEHQKYYSEKVLVSYEALYRHLEECNCQELKYTVEDIIKDAHKAVDPDTWEIGRYYSKKVYLQTQDLLTTLDKRTAEEAKQ